MELLVGLASQAEEAASAVEGVVATTQEQG